MRGSIAQPARVPVRAFPRIVITASDDPESRELADKVARHLSSGRSGVDRVRRERIERLRERGELEIASVVVEVRATLSRRDRAEWGRREVLDCLPLGCFETSRASIRDVAVLHGELVVAVADGPSGRALQRVEISEEEEGDDVLGMRLRVLDRLGRQALELVDQRTEEVPIQLFPIAHPDVQRAVIAVGNGRWEEGRVLLQLFVRSRAWQELPAEHRALVLYDLGQTLRFDRSLDADRRFDAAERVLRAAVRLTPSPLYARALDDLEHQRRMRALVREQHEATAHNFALQGGDVPPPPLTYTD